MIGFIAALDLLLLLDGPQTNLEPQRTAHLRPRSPTPELEDSSREELELLIEEEEAAYKEKLDASIDRLKDINKDSLIQLRKELDNFFWNIRDQRKGDWETALMLAGGMSFRPIFLTSSLVCRYIIDFTLFLEMENPTVGGKNHLSVSEFLKNHQGRKNAIGSRKVPSQPSQFDKLFAREEQEYEKMLMRMLHQYGNEEEETIRKIKSTLDQHFIKRRDTMASQWNEAMAIDGGMLSSARFSHLLTLPNSNLPPTARRATPDMARGRWYGQQ